MNPRFKFSVALVVSLTLAACATAPISTPQTQTEIQAHQYVCASATAAIQTVNAIAQDRQLTKAQWLLVETSARTLYPVCTSTTAQNQPWPTTEQQALIDIQTLINNLEATQNVRSG